MISQQSHEMNLVTTHPSGAEEWLCPQCGRRFVAQWQPSFRRVILEAGNEKIMHRSQGLNLQVKIMADTRHEDASDDIQLSEVWKKFLDRLDFSSDQTDDSDESA